MLFRSLVLLLSALVAPLLSNCYEVAVATVFQNETPYLKEWIEYHKLLGVDHFYLVDHLSDDHPEEVLRPYIESGLVTLSTSQISVSGRNQWEALRGMLMGEVMSRARGEVTWLLILDADEFFVPVGGKAIPDFLRQYDDGAVGAVEGLLVTFSVGEAIPDGQLMIETLLEAQGVNGLRKSAVRLDRVQGMANPYNAIPLPGFCVAQPELGELQINRYFARDPDYLTRVKIPRRERWGTPASTTMRWAHRPGESPEQALPILERVPALRKRMGLE